MNVLFIYLTVGVTVGALKWRKRPEWVRDEHFSAREMMAFVMVCACAWPIMLIHDWLDGGKV